MTEHPQSKNALFPKSILIIYNCYSSNFVLGSSIWFIRY